MILYLRVMSKMSFTRSKALINVPLKVTLTKTPSNHRLRIVQISPRCRSRNSSNICRSWAIPRRNCKIILVREVSTPCSSSLRIGPSINQKCPFNQTRKLKSWTRILTRSLLPRMLIEASTQKLRNHFIHKTASSRMRHPTQSGSHHAKISWCITLRVILTLCPRTISGLIPNRWALMNTQKIRPRPKVHVFQLRINST